MKKIIFTIIIFLLFSFNVNALTLKDGSELPKLPNKEKYFVIFNHKHFEKTILITTNNEYYLTFDYQGVSPVNTNLMHFNKKLRISDNYDGTVSDISMLFDNKWYIFSEKEKVDSNNFKIYIIENNEWVNVTNNPDYENLGTHVGLPYNEEILATNQKIYYRYPVDGHFEYKIVSENENLILFNINLYTNGGLINEEIYEVYKVQINSDGLSNLLDTIKIKKQGMYFEGWYYDKALTLSLNKDFIIYDNMNLYAKFVYSDINDILSNLNFRNETFNSNYEYAIISSENYGEDIYLGFEKLNRIDGLEIYEYDEYLNIYSENSHSLLTPIAWNNDLNIYRFSLQNTINGKYLVAVVRRIQLEQVINGNKITFYDFKVTENAHITYTNDLSQSVIMNDQQEEISTNLEPSFDYSSEYVNNDENDLMSLFSNLAKEKNNKNVFSYFNQIWNYLKKSKIFSYIMLCMSGSLIIFIIKAAYRS